MGRSRESDKDAARHDGGRGVLRSERCLWYPRGPATGEVKGRPFTEYPHPTPGTRGDHFGCVGLQQSTTSRIHPLPLRPTCADCTCSGRRGVIDWQKHSWRCFLVSTRAHAPRLYLWPSECSRGGPVPTACSSDIQLPHDSSACIMRISTYIAKRHSTWPSGCVATICSPAVSLRTQGAVARGGGARGVRSCLCTEHVAAERPMHR